MTVSRDDSPLDSIAAAVLVLMLLLSLALTGFSAPPLPAEPGAQTVAVDALDPEFLGSGERRAESGGQNQEGETYLSVSPSDPGEVDWISTAKIWAGGVASVVAAWFAWENIDVADKDESARVSDVHPSAGGATGGASAPPVDFDSAPGAALNTRFLISGPFQAEGLLIPMECGSIQPGLSFAGNTVDLGGGIVAGLTSSTTCGVVSAGGSWTQLTDTEILLTVSDPFYAGRAAITGGAIVLDNGVRLTPVGTGRLDVIERE